MENVVRSTPKNVTVRTAFVNPSTATTTQIVAAVAGKSYVVVAAFAMSTIANNINFAGGTSGALSATLPLGANGGIVLPYNEHGWFRTVANEALQVVTSAASATGVQVYYVELTN
jgi:hypothetical protein